MAYTYDAKVLEVNKESVEQLIQLMKEQGLSRNLYTTAGEARSAQTFVNSLLANLVMFRPEFKAMRGAVRTWIRYENESWVFYVGKPDRPIRGGKPLMDKAPMLNAWKGSENRSNMQSTELRFDQVITGEQVWYRFGQAMMEMGSAIQTVRAEFGRPITNTEALDLFEEWSIEVTSPTTVVYRRKAK